MHYRSSLFDTPSDSNGVSSSVTRSPVTSRRGISVDFGNGESSLPYNQRKAVTAATPEPIQALPGRPRRRKAARTKHRENGYARIVQQVQIVCCEKGLSASLWISVLLWYSLGICSIATSKLLLTGDYGVGSIRVSPLTLTLQQLFIGSTMLRGLLEIRFLGSTGHKAWPRHGKSNDPMNDSMVSSPQGRRELFMAAACFALGFLTTNFGFAGSAASFVETVKAAEPLTSATVAAVYGIETITMEQKASLGTIVTGVLVSTLSGGSSAHQQSRTATLVASAIVMTSNLCFSFRGLYQKLLRLHTSSTALDDLNLQFRMQWLGVLLLVVPTILVELLPFFWYGARAPAAIESNERHLLQVDSSSAYVRYCVLALFNGVAFTSYNLASTYILSRVSVVHHAALNCIRRVFAIIVTSVLFGIPITLTSAIGIGIAVAGFMAYTHYKVQQQHMTPSGGGHQRQSKQPISSLLPVSVMR